MSTTGEARTAPMGAATTHAVADRRLRPARALGGAMALLLALLPMLCASASASPAGGGMAARPLAGTPAPRVTKQPTSVTVEEGQSASFSATASNSPTIQWELSINGGVSWIAIEGATSTTLTIAAAKGAENANQYRALFVNAGGEVTSKAATLTVQKAPAVTKQPLDVIAEEGHNATFEAAAEGIPSPTVVWQSSTDGGKTWKNVAKGTGPVLTITSVKSAETGTNTPVAVEGLTGITEISAGDQDSVALQASGGLVAWGGNTAGSLGVGTLSRFTTSREQPVCRQAAGRCSPSDRRFQRSPR